MNASIEDQKVVHIQYCKSCVSHVWCTHHNEQKYRQTYLDVATQIRKNFPKLTVIGNQIPSHFVPVKAKENKFYDSEIKKYVIYPAIGAFEIVMNDTVLFSKKNTNTWPNIEQILKLIQIELKEKGELKHSKVSNQKSTITIANKILKDIDHQAKSSKKHNDQEELTLTDHFKRYKMKKNSPPETFDYLLAQSEPKSNKSHQKSNMSKLSSEDIQNIHQIWGNKEELPKFIKDKAFIHEQQGQKQMIVNLSSIEEQDNNKNKQNNKVSHPIKNRSNTSAQIKSKHQLLQNQFKQLQKKFDKFQHKVSQVNSKGQKPGDTISTLKPNNKITNSSSQMTYQSRLNLADKIKEVNRTYNGRQMFKNIKDRKKRKIQQYIFATNQYKNQKLEEIYGREMIKQMNKTGGKKNFDRRKQLSRYNSRLNHYKLQSEQSQFSSRIHGSEDSNTDIDVRALKKSNNDTTNSLYHGKKFDQNQSSKDHQSRKKILRYSVQSNQFKFKGDKNSNNPNNKNKSNNNNSHNKQLLKATKTNQKKSTSNENSLQCRSYLEKSSIAKKNKLKPNHMQKYKQNDNSSSEESNDADHKMRKKKKIKVKLQKLQKTSKGSRVELSRSEKMIRNHQKMLTEKRQQSQQNSIKYKIKNKNKQKPNKNNKFEFEDQEKKSKTKNRNKKMVESKQDNSSCKEGGSSKRIEEEQQQNQKSSNNNRSDRNKSIQQEESEENDRIIRKTQKNKVKEKSRIVSKRSRSATQSQISRKSKSKSKKSCSATKSHKHSEKNKQKYQKSKFMKSNQTQEEEESSNQFSESQISQSSQQSGLSQNQKREKKKKKNKNKKAKKLRKLLHTPNYQQNIHKKKIWRTWKKQNQIQDDDDDQEHKQKQTSPHKFMKSKKKQEKGKNKIKEKKQLQNSQTQSLRHKTQQKFSRKKMIKDNKSQILSTKSEKNNKKNKEKQSQKSSFLQKQSPKKKNLKTKKQKSKGSNFHSQEQSFQEKGSPNKSNKPKKINKNKESKRSQKQSQKRSQKRSQKSPKSQKIEQKKKKKISPQKESIVSKHSKKTQKSQKSQKSKKSKKNIQKSLIISKKDVKKKKNRRAETEKSNNSYTQDDETELSSVQSQRLNKSKVNKKAKQNKIQKSSSSLKKSMKNKAVETDEIPKQKTSQQKKQNSSQKSLQSNKSVEVGKRSENKKKSNNSTRQSLFKKQEEQRDMKNSKIKGKKLKMGRAKIINQFFGQKYQEVVNDYWRPEKDTIENKQKAKNMLQIYPKGVLFDSDNIQPQKIIDNSGKLGNVVKVIKMLCARNQFLIIRLFENPDESYCKKFSVWLCDRYRWRLFTVTDTKQEINLSHIGEQFWPIILEKTLTELYGSFDNLANANVTDLFHTLTGSNYISFRVKEDPTKNKNLLKFITSNQKKNFIIYAQKRMVRSINEDEEKNNQIFIILSQKTVTSNNSLETVLRIKKEGSDPFWVKLQKFVSEFSRVDVLQLRINHNFCFLSINKSKKQMFNIVQMNFSQQCFGSLAVGSTTNETDIRIYLYKQEEDNVLRLVGELKQKNKRSSFFDCCFESGKYYVFTETKNTDCQVSYMGEGKPLLKIHEQITGDSLKNNSTEYVPIDFIPKKDSYNMPIFLSATHKGESELNGKQELKNQFIDFLTKK